MNPLPRNYPEIFKNVKLSLVNKLKYLLGINKYKKFSIPDEYDLVFIETFSSKNLKKWQEASTWWEQPYHPGDPKQWFDPEQVKFTEEGLALHSVRKSKQFGDITIQNAIGMIQSIGSWQYGIFIIKAKLPKGKYLWPAIWLTGAYTWPPEIDIVEGYSDNTDDYHSGRKLQSNVHFNYKNNRAHIGGANHYLPKVTDNFVDYAVWWESEFIRIYYNGNLVREITDPDILKSMDQPQKVVLNNAVQLGFTKDNITPLIISGVAIYKN